MYIGELPLFNAYFSRASFSHMTQIGGQCTSCSAGMKARVSYRLSTSHPPSHIPILSLSALSWHAQGPFPLMVRCLAKLMCIIPACLSPLGIRISLLGNVSLTRGEDVWMKAV